MTTRIRAALVLVAACVALAVPRVARAHAASDGFLTLNFPDDAPKTIAGRWDLALSDLDAALAFARNADGALTPEAVMAREQDVDRLLFTHLALRADGAQCKLTPSGLDFTHHEDAVYLSVPFAAECPDVPAVVDVDYSLFFDRSGPLPPHRGLVRIEDGKVERSTIMSSGFRHERFVRKGASQRSELGAAVANGILHIGSGADHILFLLALLLPSVLRREGASLVPVSSFGAAVRDVAKIVTGFTVAHSITLSLSALDVVRIPSRVVEPAIAASVVVAAVLNLVRPSSSWLQRTLARGARWPVAFVLGLLHGFGFSAALKDLGLARHALVVTLFGFNLGVEIGQLAVVLVFLPLAYAARRTKYYRPVVLVGGSVVIAVIASVWFVQRAFPSLAA